MTDLERAQKIIEQYIHTLTWTPAATDDDITLVHGNVRGMASTIAAALAAVREEAAQVVPTHWCDAMLTGPTRVIGAPPYACQDIEQLLRHIAAAIRAKGGT